MSKVKIDAFSTICNAFPEALENLRRSRDPAIVNILQHLNLFNEKGVGWDQQIDASTLRFALENVNEEFFQRSGGAIAMVSRSEDDKPIQILEVFDRFGPELVAEVIDYGSAKPLRNQSET